LPLASATEYLDLAKLKISPSMSHQNQNVIVPQQNELVVNTLEELNAILEKIENISTEISFNINGNKQLDDAFVKSYLNVRKDLSYLISEKLLIPISQVDIQPNSQLLIVLLYTPIAKNRPYIQAKPKKQDIKLFVKLLEYDLYLLPLDSNGDKIIELPVRELLIRFLIVDLHE
jgi:hypothetical protein